MKKVESIWAELSAKAQEVSKEVELTEEQVELASAKEVKSMASKVNALQKKVRKQTDNSEAKGEVAYRATLDLNESVSELKDLMSRLNKDMNDVSKQLKDLGMNANDVPALSSSLDIIKDANQAVILGERQVKAESKGFKV
ncbi:MAG: hypothetical protein GY861_18970 [bacterium]|nr:hypothetical protein [bacterium]